MQPYTRYRQSHYGQLPKRSAKTGSTHLGALLVIAAAIGLVWCFTFMNLRAHAATSLIKSGVAGLCLDDHKSLAAANAMVDAWGCNDTAAQSWMPTDTQLIHNDTYCLAVLNDATVSGSRVVLSPCSSDPGQVWLSDNGGYKNPNSGLCLSVPNAQAGVSLTITNCHVLSEPGQHWSPVTDKGSSDTASCNSGSEGQRVACDAIKQWTIWQSGSPSHNTLLNNYSDGNGYEAWCADFVSYVYRAAGYPFTQGERGWDEYNANNIQYQGFTYHDAVGYDPQPGDVAYFDYAAGHVEIVISGGPTPTFVYGDSATIDPITGNGQMEANTIQSDGSFGQVMYYLSPN